jgi:hypothetical protein
MRGPEDRNIYWDRAVKKGNKSFKVQVGIEGKNVTLGWFHTAEEARAYRDEWLETHEINGFGPKKKTPIEGVSKILSSG